MTRKRSRYRPRIVNANVVNTTILNATRLTQAEVTDQMRAWHTLAKAFREGVASEDQFFALRTLCTLALAIEGTGIIRGLQAHFIAAITALDAIAARARAHGTWWQPGALHFHEIDAITDAVWLHQEQLKVISAGELRRVANALIADGKRRGDHVVVLKEAPAPARPFQPALSPTLTLTGVPT